MSGGNKKMFCGIGKSEITPTTINITDYPFEPSSIFPSRNITPSEISYICLGYLTMPTVVLNLNETTPEFIFLGSAHRDELESFAKKNKIIVKEPSEKWSLLTEPYLDRDISASEASSTLARLQLFGVSADEAEQLRATIANAMFTYNISSCLWDDFNLSMSDVMQAMRASLSEEEYKKFYWMAMEVESR
jgi:hypothetical protein